jgi:hypothetical protein
MVFNATFNNISAILWLSVLLVEETRDSSKFLWMFNKVLSDVRGVVVSFSGCDV